MIELPSHLHPMVVHFPIALFIVALLFEMIGLVTKNQNFHKAAMYMYVTAALITPIVVRTGMFEAQKLGLRHAILDQHNQYAVWLMWTTLMSLPVLWFVNKEFQKYLKFIFIIFLMASAILVSLTADKGGQMVYKYGVGVDG